MHTDLRTWEGKKQKAIERLIAVRKKHGADPEAALGTLTVAHVAAKFDVDRGPSRGWLTWVTRRDRAVERVIAAWEEIAAGRKVREAKKALDLALDEVAVAHAAFSFEWSRQQPSNMLKRDGGHQTGLT